MTQADENLKEEIKAEEVYEKDECSSDCSC
jgi:hypothetical protein